MPPELITMKNTSSDILRIIDANINRTGEGLRVLEEFARLSLDNVSLTQQFKDLRHKVLHTGTELQKQLLSARDAAKDVGSAMDVPGETASKDTSEIVIANARRVQESLRVLEELAKNPGTGLNSENYRQGRFQLYTIEKELLGRLTRQDLLKKITGLYVIIDTEWFKGRKPEELTIQAIRGGANTIQLRCKTGNKREFLSIALKLKDICLEKGIPFIINDSLEIALACGADGLHIGQEDLPAKIARQFLPIDILLGVSARNLEEAKNALADGADYLGVGAVFDTKTKDSAAIGLKTLKSIKQAVNLPLVAIGGISKDNIKSVMQAGADAAAVISAVLGAEDVARATAELVKIIGGQKHE
jgi:thiamine-phosphate pyrophosphorylase